MRSRKTKNCRHIWKKQIEGYRKFHNEARDILNRSGYDEKGLGTFEKIRTYLMVNLQTMADDSTSHIAKMLIQGAAWELPKP